MADDDPLLAVEGLEVPRVIPDRFIIIITREMPMRAQFCFLLIYIVGICPLPRLVRKPDTVMIQRTKIAGEADVFHFFGKDI